jgi:hypothetical protein
MPRIRVPRERLKSVPQDKNEIPAGFCQCGCGQRTKICTQDQPARGRVKGQPFRFLQGHGRRKFHLEYIYDPEIGYGKCHCGCGEETTICDGTDAAAGAIKGKPRLYCRGHSGEKKGHPQYVIDEKTGCWIWQWSKGDKGYGRVRVEGKSYAIPAHVHYYQQRFGPIPDGLQLDHRCRNRACVNPEHLEPVTCLVNVRRGLVPKINITIARAIKDDLRQGMKRRHIAKKHQVSLAIIDSIRRGQTWKDA